jgi:hypothetical protein
MPFSAPYSVRYGLLALPFALPACSSPGSSPVTLERSRSGVWTQSGDPSLPWFSYALTSADHEMRSGAEQSVYGNLPERLHCRRVTILSESDHAAAGYMAQAYLAGPLLPRFREEP